VRPAFAEGGEAAGGAAPTLNPGPVSEPPAAVTAAAPEDGQPVLMFQEQLAARLRERLEQAAGAPPPSAHALAPALAEALQWRPRWCDKRSAERGPPPVGGGPPGGGAAAASSSARAGAPPDQGLADALAALVRRNEAGGAAEGGVGASGGEAGQARGRSR